MNLLTRKATALFITISCVLFVSACHQNNSPTAPSETPVIRDAMEGCNIAIILSFESINRIQLSPTQSLQIEQTKEIASSHAIKNAANSTFTAFSFIWTLRDSNPGPSGYEPDALTN